MIRVLNVVGTMDTGGAETFIMNLYRNMDREKVQFDFLCHNRIEAKYTDEIRSMGGKMFMVNGITHGGFLKYEKSLYKFFKEHPEYKTVHSHNDLLSGVILTQAKKAGVKNRYSHSHSTYKMSSFFSKIYAFILKLFFVGSVTHAFACADAAGTALYMGKNKKKFEVISNGVDTSRFVFTKEKRVKILKELGLEDKIVIGHVGRFVEAKNHKFLIEIFSEISKIDDNVRLVLVGEGKLKADTEKQVKELGLTEKVIFLGSRSDINEILSAFDLLLFPSLYEGLSVAMVEAQTSGVPILASDTVSSEVAITDRVKQISLEKRPKEWAENSLEMIKANENINREQYARKVTEAGFDIRETAKKLQEFYLKNEE